MQFLERKDRIARVASQLTNLRTAKRIQNDLEAVPKALKGTDARAAPAERKALLKKMRQLIAETGKSQ